MQNNFEKNVRQKMEELKLTPPAAVWEKIELEIAPEKKRRRGIFWFSLAGFFLFGGWCMQQAFNKELERLAKQTTGSPQSASNKSSDQSSIKEEKNTPARHDAVTASGVQEPTITKAVISVANLEQKLKVERKTPFIKAEKTLLEKGAIFTAPNFSSKEKEDKGDVVATAKTGASPIDQKNTTAVAIVDSTAIQVIATKTLVSKEDSVATKKETKVDLLPVVDSTAKKSDSVLKKQPALAKGWRRQISFGAGISGYAKGPFFNGFNSSTRDAFYASTLSSPGSIPVVAAAQPSSVKSGFAFSLGFSLVKSLSKRWELSIGLQYAYASTHQKVGDKKTADTTVQFAMDKAATSSFYSNGGTTDYTARFHFIELPVSLSFKPFLRVPLSISLGAAYGRLLSTNALTFSSASNLYYQNKENYLRNAVNISASVQVDVLSKKTLWLRTGPFVQYNAVKLRKENSDGSPHLLTAGIKTALIF